jgi:hypothetical protein
LRLAEFNAREKEQVFQGTRHILILSLTVDAVRQPLPKVLSRTVSDKQLQKIELISYPIIRPTPIPALDGMAYGMWKGELIAAVF